MSKEAKKKKKKNRVIEGGKVRHDLNREAAKISALQSGDIDKYEYLIGEDFINKDIKE